GQEIDLEFHRYLRPEKKFPDARSLSDQIRKDVEAVLTST
ncbi:MAG TPA: hypothetical protein DIT30_02635, partial [Verrucomicrobiales bacterium]|nr:hypothetical protein [Verrucomicrobiales bacterium]